ncbi:MAG: hypothetical protein GEV13_31115 [Rhodospirillales bacterium]|nr:hypothetical protein [Rhodospirillales bacterium]
MPDAMPRVRGHIGRLEQVLVNLINNARDAGASAIQIDGERAPDAAPPVVRLRVLDNGPGIPADVLPRLFVSFITTKPQGKGTGLGLRICRRIVEEMGGKISASNRPEDGACVEVMLPLRA